MEPVNHWQPVTNEYQQEMAPIKGERSARKKKRRQAAVWQYTGRPEKELPAGILCFTWFYFVRAGVYFLFALALFSRPSSILASLLIENFRVMIPFPIRQTVLISPGNMVAEALCVMAVVSIILGILWMARYAGIRWITLCYTGASLIRTALYFVTDRNLGLVSSLTAGQKEALLIGSIADVLIFCYLALYTDADRAFEIAN